MSQSSLVSPEAAPLHLLREVHHRMANSQAMLAAMLRREFIPFRDVELRQALRRCEVQVLAASELNRLLGTWGSTETTGDYFRSVCALLSKAVLTPLGISCEVFVADGTLPEEQRTYLAVILAELVTNASKHAFRGQSSGCVRVEIETAGAEWLVRVIDNGFGFSTFEKGTGSRIVDSLVEMLGAEFTLDTGTQGTEICIALHT